MDNRKGRYAQRKLLLHFAVTLRQSDRIRRRLAPSAFQLGHDNRGSLLQPQASREFGAGCRCPQDPASLFQSSRQCLNKPAARQTVPPVCERHPDSNRKALPTRPCSYVARRPEDVSSRQSIPRPQLLLLVSSSLILKD